MPQTRRLIYLLLCLIRWQSEEEKKKGQPSWRQKINLKWVQCSQACDVFKFKSSLALTLLSGFIPFSPQVCGYDGVWASTGQAGPCPALPQPHCAHRFLDALINVGSAPEDLGGSPGLCISSKFWDASKAALPEFTLRSKMALQTSYKRPSKRA